MPLEILAFFAHPDDETMLCGGTLALLASLGVRVHILIATRGEGGEMGDPPICARDQLGQVRENELRSAAQKLGAASLTLMNYIDPAIGPGNQLFPFTENIEEVAVQVEEAARYRKVDVILAHGVNGEYGHPAHKLAHQAAGRAIRALGPDAPLFYTNQAIFPGHPYPRLANSDEPAHIVIDITPVIQQKIDAALCHRTQHDLFIRYWSEQTGRKLTVPEIIMSVESLHRVCPLFTGPGKIHDPFADLLWVSGCASKPVLV